MIIPETISSELDRFPEDGELTDELVSEAGIDLLVAKRCRGDIVGEAFLGGLIVGKRLATTTTTTETDDNE